MSQAATLFGLGRIPFAPGTIGSLVTLPIAWLAMWTGGMYAVLALAAIVSIFGIWASDAYAHEIGEHDPSECIIDEVAGQMLACALSPLTPQNTTGILNQGAICVTFRFYFQNNHGFLPKAADQSLAMEQEVRQDAICVAAILVDYSVN